MKKIILAVFLVSSSALLANCASSNPCCAPVTDTSCCGGNSYSGIWY